MILDCEGIIAPDFLFLGFDLEVYACGVLVLVKFKQLSRVAYG
jgi:hypothetical protein